MALIDTLMDQEVEDSSLVGGQSESEMISVGLDGLIQSQLEKKVGRLEVILNFMTDFALLDTTVQPKMVDLDIKLQMANIICRYQERLKHDYQNVRRSSGFSSSIKP